MVYFPSSIWWSLFVMVLWSITPNYWLWYHCWVIFHIIWVGYSHLRDYGSIYMTLVLQT